MTDSGFLSKESIENTSLLILRVENVLPLLWQIPSSVYKQGQKGQYDVREMLTFSRQFIHLLTVVPYQLKEDTEIQMIVDR